jgi:hypothetical protein
MRQGQRPIGVVQRINIKLKDGKALVRVNSHRARHKMQQALGRLPQGYYNFYLKGEWREVTPEELQKLKDAKIKGISESRWNDQLRRCLPF